MKKILQVHNFRVKAPLGFYEEERILGTELRFDLKFCFRNTQSIEHLDQTIDYEEVCAIIRRQMKNEYQLIERAAEDVYKEIENRFGNLARIELILSKLNPPINGLGSTSFTIGNTD